MTPFDENGHEKPPILYHGSTDGEIREFEPRGSDRRPDEEPAVYASPDLLVAEQSMVNRFASNGGVVDGRHYVCIPMSKEEFLKQDTGGCIYVLPNDSFEVNQGRGFGDAEWVSQKPVTPTKTIRYPSLYQTLIERGVEVYFISPDQVSEINTLQDGDPRELALYLDRLDK